MALDHGQLVFPLVPAARREVDGPQESGGLLTRRLRLKPWQAARCNQPMGPNAIAPKSYLLLYESVYIVLMLYLPKSSLPCCCYY